MRSFGTPSKKENAMNRSRAFAAILGAASALGLAAAALAHADEPKKATVKLVPKYTLKVKGYFAGDGFHIDEVDANGPAARLDDGNGGTAMMEKGDVITAVDGIPIRSPQDYARAMNGAADHSKTRVKVKDVNTGKEMEFTTDAEKL
jgi:S1-C subfamily serine protease